MCGPGGYMSGGIMLLFALIWLAVLAGIVVLIVWAVRQTGAGGRRPEDALAILDTRYARGEITREDYERMKREISERKT